MQLSVLTLLVAAIALPMQSLAFMPGSMPLRHSAGSVAGVKSVFGSRAQPPVVARSSLLGLNMAEKQTFKNFDDMIENSDKPLLVDFYAVWCGPCVLMGRELSQLSESMKDEVTVVKIDTEKYPKITNRFDVYALPTCILFKDGKPLERIEGVMKHDQLKALVESKLK